MCSSDSAQVIDCRRILKWTYAYGFYSFGGEDDNADAVPLSKEQQVFFEFSQVCSCTACVHPRYWHHVSLHPPTRSPMHVVHMDALPVVCHTAPCTPTNPQDPDFCTCGVLQGQAESYLEKLHKMVEQDMSEFLDASRPPTDWPAFRETLIGLTDVTQVRRSHFF